MRFPLALLSAVAILSAPLAAQSDDGTTFRWSGRVQSGNTLRVHNMNGDVRIERAAGLRDVEVIAERRVERGDPKLVRFDVRMRADGDVVICALWGQDMQCTDSGTSGSYNGGGWRNNNQTSVTVRVRLPDGVKSYARSTNGSVSIEGVTAAVDAATTNGNVNVSTTSAQVNATTTNGSVIAAIGGGVSDQPMRFTSTNGSVTVYAPSSLAADVEIATTNGELKTDFPLTINGSFRRNQIRGTLGGGGRSLILRSTNGDVSLRRRGTEI